jgi:hypothetical protein
MTKRRLSLALGLALSGTAAEAHHSIAGMYDGGRQVRVEGVVSSFEFVNPHPFVTLEVAAEGGAVRSWRLEMDNRREMTSIGMDAGTLRRGDRLMVSGSPARREADRLYIQTLERPSDGYSYHQVGSRPRLRSAGRS